MEIYQHCVWSNYGAPSSVCFSSCFKQGHSEVWMPFNVRGLWNPGEVLHLVFEQLLPKLMHNIFENVVLLIVYWWAVENFKTTGEIIQGTSSFEVNIFISLINPAFPSNSPSPLNTSSNSFSISKTWLNVGFYCFSDTAKVLLQL